MMTSYAAWLDVSGVMNDVETRNEHVTRAAAPETAYVVKS